MLIRYKTRNDHEQSYRDTYAKDEGIISPAVSLRK